MTIPPAAASPTAALTIQRFTLPSSKAPALPPKRDSAQPPPGTRWHVATTPAFVNIFDVVPDGKGGNWFGAQAILAGGKWASPQLPAFTGSSGLVTRIPGTASFVLNAGVQTDQTGTVKPTIFRFDL